MTTEILVVEDWGERTRAVEAAAAMCGVDVSVETGVAWIAQQRSPAALAKYDAFLVDFDLSTARIRSRQPPSFRAPVAGSRLTVEVTTGIGVMLFLWFAMKTESYRQARMAAGRGRPPARIVSFAELDEVRSKFFAVAAAEWLGAGFFRAVPDRTQLADYLESLGASRDRAPEPTIEEATVDGARPAFRELMDWAASEKAFTASSAFSPALDGLPFETYDFLKAYHLTAGRSYTMVGKEPMQRHCEMIHELTGAHWKPKNPTAQWGREMGRVQNRLSTFLDLCADYEHTVELDEGFSQDNATALKRVLEESTLFWTAPDVRTALTVCRSGQPGNETTT